MNYIQSLCEHLPNHTFSSGFSSAPTSHFELCIEYKLLPPETNILKIKFTFVQSTPYLTIGIIQILFKLNPYLSFPQFTSLIKVISLLHPHNKPSSLIKYQFVKYFLETHLPLSTPRFRDLIMLFILIELPTQLLSHFNLPLLLLLSH